MKLRPKNCSETVININEVEVRRRVLLDTLSLSQMRSNFPLRRVVDVLNEEAQAHPNLLLQSARLQESYEFDELALDVIFRKLEIDKGSIDEQLTNQITSLYERLETRAEEAGDMRRYCDRLLFALVCAAILLTTFPFIF